MATDWAARQKLVDPYNFVKAEDFFQNLDNVAASGEQASAVTESHLIEKVPVTGRTLVLEFGNGKALSICFIRPRVWLIRCNFEDAGESEVEQST